MRKARYTLVLFVLLFLGLTVAVPGEDLAETAYDESETQPCERTPLFSDVLPLATASATEGRESPTGRQAASPYGVTATRIDGTDCHRFVEVREALAFLCTLVC